MGRRKVSSTKGGFGNGMWNNPFMYLVWMWMMRWMNRGEFGEGNNCQNLQSAEIQGQLAGLREQMNTNQNTQLLMDAIKGNSAALGQLATNLNCDFWSIERLLLQYPKCNYYCRWTSRIHF